MNKICTCIAALFLVWNATASDLMTAETTPVELNHVRLYVPIRELPVRVGTDAAPLANYMKALQKAAADCIQSSAPSKAKGMLIAVGIKADKKSRIWCQAVEGEMPRELLLKLETELGKIEPIALTNKPMGLAMELRLRGQKPEKFPEFPDVWVEAAKKTRTHIIVPPDELFELIWPDSGKKNKT